MSKADEWNKARKEKMAEHDCWECRYFNYCDPRKPCKLEKQKLSILNKEEQK